MTTRTEDEWADVSPHLARLAQQLGITRGDLPARGTGVAGRISRQDVLAATAARSAMPAAAASRPSAPDDDGPYGRNPLVATAKREDWRYAAAVRKAPPPTLFHAGDVPAFTSSGLDPRELLRLPWVARHAVAAAPRTEAYRLVQRCTGPDAALEAGLACGRHIGVYEYAQRVERWLADGGVDAGVLGNVG